MIAKFQWSKWGAKGGAQGGIWALLLVGLYLAFPSDVWWLNDEPQLFQAALARNQLWEWWGPGLSGPTGNPYGPLPIFLYQLMLHLTHDLKTIVLLKTLIGGGCVVVAIVFASKQLRLSRMSWLFVFLSPFVYSYLRCLWDNCFLIPVSGLLHLAYLRYLKSGSKVSLTCWAFFGLLALHIHLMSLIALLPMTLGLALFEGGHWKRHWEFALGLAVLCVLLSFPYLESVLVRDFSTPYRERLFLSEALLSPIAGLRVLTGAAFIPYFIPGILSAPAGAFLNVLGWATVLAIIPFLVGLKLGWKNSLKNPSVVQARFYWVMVGELAATVAVFIFMKTKLEPHYSNATWFVYWVFLAFGMQASIRRFHLIWIAKGVLCAMAILLLVNVYWIRENGGDRGPHYGPTLGEQVRVARQLSPTCLKDRVFITAKPISDYPLSLEVLCQLYGMADAPPFYRTVVRYHSEQSTGAFLELVASNMP